MLAVAGPAVAQGYSRNCKADKKVYIPDGNYEGTLEGGMTSTFGAEGVSLNHELKLQGTFKLKVDRASKTSGVLSGEASTTFRMKGSGLGISMDAPTTGKYALSLKSVASDSFTANGKSTESGTVIAKGQDINVAQPIVRSGNAAFAFTATGADCESAEGTLRMDTLDDALAELEKEGAKVNRAPITWRMKSVDGSSDRIKKLQDELNQAPPAGIDRTRDAEATRLGTIADRNDIKSSECLFMTWREFVVQQSLKWEQEDTAKLNAYNGDYAGLADLVSRGLSSDKALSLLGMDTCSEAVHNALWSAIGEALGRLLERMSKTAAPPADILKALKDAEVLGTVSPALQQKAMRTVQKQATDIAEALYQALSKALAAAKGAPGDPKQNPAVKAAASKALAAEKECDLIGADKKHSALQLLGR